VVEIYVPDLLGDLGTGEHLALAPHQQRQKLKLLCGQFQTLAGAHCTSPRQVHLQVTQRQQQGVRRRRGVGGAAQQYLDAGHQFGEGERLDEIVVRAGFSGRAHGLPHGAGRSA
jgi:hypothetical protein